MITARWLTYEILHVHLRETRHCKVAGDKMHHVDLRETSHCKVSGYKIIISKWQAIRCTMFILEGPESAKWEAISYTMLILERLGTAKCRAIRYLSQNGRQWATPCYLRETRQMQGGWHTSYTMYIQINQYKPDNARCVKSEIRHVEIREEWKVPLRTTNLLRPWPWRHIPQNVIAVSKV